MCSLIFRISNSTMYNIVLRIGNEKVQYSI